jgi:hypothetical protein
MYGAWLRPSVGGAGRPPAPTTEDTMSTYIDPATALRLARDARAQQLRAGEERRLLHPRRAADAAEVPSERRHLLRIAWHGPAAAH